MTDAIAPDTIPARGRVILKLSVQLPDGQKGSIHVFPGSDPRELAEQFCEKHTLSDPKLLRVVERHIVDNMRHLSKPNRSSPSTSIAPSGSRLGGSDVQQPRDPSTASSSAYPPSGLARARELALRWRDSARSEQLLRCCWSAFVELLWQGRMRRFRDAAHAEAEAARAAEIEELHAANARIATLAFAQAGRSPEQAATELRALLEPSGTSARRAQEQLERVLSREVHHPWRATAPSPTICRCPQPALTCMSSEPGKFFAHHSCMIGGLVVSSTEEAMTILRPRCLSAFARANGSNGTSSFSMAILSCHPRNPLTIPRFWSSTRSRMILPHLASPALPLASILFRAANTSGAAAIRPFPSMSDIRNPSRSPTYG